MAEENLLPSTLEKLEIDCPRESTHNPEINPFSVTSGGICKKMKKLSSDVEPDLWNLSLSGEKCSSSTCKCNQQRAKYHGWNKINSIEHTKSTTTFKKHLIHKSKLNFLEASKKKKMLKSSSVNLIRDPVLKFDITERFCKQADRREVLSNCNSSCQATNEPFGLGAEGDFGSLLDEISHEKEQTKTDYTSASFLNLRKNKNESYKLKKSSSITNCSSSNSTGNNQSCSQQALMGAQSSCDDVTIDELASYFDVFVHIPKKMSHMAEMMYI